MHKRIWLWVITVTKPSNVPNGDRTGATPGNQHNMSTELTEYFTHIHGHGLSLCGIIMHACIRALRHCYAFTTRLTAPRAHLLVTHVRSDRHRQSKNQYYQYDPLPFPAAEGQHSGDNRNSSSIDNDETTPPPPPPNTAGADEAAGAARTWRQRSRSFVASDSVTDVATAAATQLPSNAAAAAVGAAAIEYLHAADVKQSPIIVGDLSCLKDKFRPAPAVANADIKYLR